MSYRHPKTGQPIRGNKGPTKHSFTYEDIAEAVGMKLRSVRAAKARGDFDPTDLVSLATWVVTKTAAPGSTVVDLYVQQVRSRVERITEEKLAEHRAKARADAEACHCPLESRRDGFSTSTRAFHCMDCGKVTRTI